MFSVNNLSVQFNGEYLFNQVSFIINKRDRIGLVGKNGAGKTTMLRIINSEMQPDEGQVVRPDQSVIGYLPQQMKLTSKRSVLDETFEAFTEANRLEKNIDQLTREIAIREDFESQEYQSLIDKLNETNQRFALIGGDKRQGNAEKVLIGLGFEPSDFSRKMSEFSGGWQMRVELAKILLSGPDLLMLDEPTNHLDIESIQWMESFLESYQGSLILISHDRAFLDNVTHRTIEIANGKIYDYKASYSDYEILQQERLEQQNAMFANQQKEIQQIEKFINRFRAKATKARQVQSRIKLLEKMDRVEIDEPDMSGIQFRFNLGPPSGKVIFESDNLSKSYGDNNVLSGLDFIINRGEKIAFVGRNGEGKTTLSRILVGQLDYSGTLKRGHNVVIGYYAQNQAEFLDGEKTVFQTLDDIATGEARTKVRSILGGFLFQGDEVDKKVKVLSGGEKSRLAIARLLLSPVNVLVLDEPTNHLDMRSKDILKSALLQFDGTIILVSHDRDFLQGLSSRIFEFKNRKINEHLGDIYDFIGKRKIQNLDDLHQGNKKTGEYQPSHKNNSSDKKKNWEIQKQLGRDKRKIENQVKQIEEKITNLEKQLKETEQIVSNPSNYNEKPEDYQNIFDKYAGIKKKIAENEQRWETLHLELDELELKIEEFKS